MGLNNMSARAIATPEAREAYEAGRVKGIELDNQSKITAETIINGAKDSDGNDTLYTMIENGGGVGNLLQIL
ncbi:MAG: hypothetical protein Q4B73_09900 [Lachnospiraceae bacterium]|nr:hypothetical protein [Lachnospiraceae bacterium]